MEKSIARYLDHAVLKPELSRKEAIKAIQLGIDYNVKTVCVRPCDIDIAVEMCKGTNTDVSCVLGFPHGTFLSETKAEEAKLYTKKGVKEIDMVINYSFIKSGEWELVEKDIKAVSAVTRPVGVTLKVIFETSMLSDDEIAKTTKVCIKSGADFVKTSTGFNGAGATEEVINIMLENSDGKVKVKASGGIRDTKRAKMFVDMGCHRLGVNYMSTPVIVNVEAKVGDDKSEY